MLTWHVNITNLHGWKKQQSGRFTWKVKTLERGAECEWKAQMISEECDFEDKGMDLGPVLNQLEDVFVNLVSILS